MKREKGESNKMKYHYIIPVVIAVLMYRLFFIYTFDIKSSSIYYVTDMVLSVASHFVDSDPTTTIHYEKERYRVNPNAEDREYSGSYVTAMDSSDILQSRTVFDIFSLYGLSALSLVGIVNRENLMDVRYNPERRQSIYVPRNYFKEDGINNDNQGKLEIVIEYPKNRQNNKKYPLIIHFFGGGQVIGSAPDDVISIFANEGNLPDCIIAHVSYRLSPEHPFPASGNDALLALRYLVKEADKYGIDKDKIVLHGISAGGLLVASTSALARKYGIKVKLQVLIVPMLMYNTLAPSNIGAPFYASLSLRKIMFFWGVFGSHDPRGCVNDVRCSPLSAIDNYQNLPNTIVVSANADPLRSDAIRYVQNLKSANITVSHFEARGTHVFGWIVDFELRKSFLADFKSKMENL